MDISYENLKRKQSKLKTLKTVRLVAGIICGIFLGVSVILRHMVLIIVSAAIFVVVIFALNLLISAVISEINSINKERDIAGLNPRDPILGADDDQETSITQEMTFEEAIKAIKEEKTADSDEDKTSERKED